MTIRTVEVIRNEIRYGQRMAERTARLYRRLQTFGTFSAVVAGSGTLSALIPHMPAAVPIVSGVLMTFIGAALVAIRPADKAAANEADARRYAGLLVKYQRLGLAELDEALREVQVACAPEIEALRNVVYNDVVTEVGQLTHRVELNRSERLIAALA